MNDGETFVYVIALKRDDEIYSPVKIGLSKNPQSRIKTMQTSCPHELVLIAQFWLPSRKMAGDIERMFHDTQDSYRLRGEWFVIQPAVATQKLALGIECVLHAFLRSFGRRGLADKTLALIRGDIGLYNIEGGGYEINNQR